jgi:hypothetical protein
MATASSTETEKLAPLDARRPGSFTMYRSERKLDLEQIAFAAECILLGALDMIEGGLPTSIDWADRQQWANRIVEEPLELSPYERGALEAAGEALGILYAQLTGDGICCYEALEPLADGFDAAVERMVRESWHDQGQAVEQAVDRERQEHVQFRSADVVPGYPDCRRHAVAFARKLLSGGDSC